MSDSDGIYALAGGVICAFLMYRMMMAWGINFICEIAHLILGIKPDCSDLSGNAAGLTLAIAAVITVVFVISAAIFGFNITMQGLR